MDSLYKDLTKGIAPGNLSEGIYLSDGVYLKPRRKDVVIIPAECISDSEERLIMYK